MRWWVERKGGAEEGGVLGMGAKRLDVGLDVVNGGWWWCVG